MRGGRREKDGNEKGKGELKRRIKGIVIKREE